MATPQPVQIVAQEAVSPIDDVFGALGGEMDEVAPNVPIEVIQRSAYIILSESFLPSTTTTKS